MSNYFIPTGPMGYDANCGIGGVYNTRTFSEIFPDAETFLQTYLESGLAIEESRVSDKNMIVLYYLMLSRWANSHPKAANDENRFIMSIFSTVFMYGPAWETKLYTQKKIRDLLESDELFDGSININNHAFNPSTTPSTDEFSPLNYINDQTANKWKKSKLEGYGMLMEVMKNDITKEFLDKFDKLFRNMLNPDGNLYYTTTPEEQEILEK